jgi:hypothetical protein
MQSGLERGDRDGDADEPQVLGMDIYLVAFLFIGGCAVLFAIYVLFFSRLPLPRYCGGGKGGYHCGWIYRGEPLPTIHTATR